VDGGYFSKQLVGYDIHAYRSIAIYSTFTRNQLVKTTYFPAKTPKINFKLADIRHSIRDSEKFGNILRSISELEVAREVIKNSPKRIDFLLLDGSPFLKYPGSTNTESLRLYQEYLDLLVNLFKIASKSCTKLLWIVKDSRINTFTLYLGKVLTYISHQHPELLEVDYRNIINRTRDMDLYYYLLEINTRSFALRKDYSVSENFDQAFQFYQFYLKTAQYDIPLRIECALSKRQSFPAITKTLNTIAETILPISQYNKKYGVPSPIVEADARVKIKENEINDFFRFLRALNPSPDFHLRRRDRSPWKF
jgi:hypothetical protein